MLLVKDVDFHTVEAQFHEAVFTHASTSPNQQLIASLDVARRQMELEGYGLVHERHRDRARRSAGRSNSHPLISKYFRMLGADEMVPAEYRQSGFTDFLAPGRELGDARRSHAGGRVLPRSDAHDAGLRHRGLRRHAVQGPAGRANTTSRSTRPRATACCCSPTSTTRAATSRTDPGAGRDLPARSTSGWRRVARARGEAFAARVKSLMTDVPDLPNFSRFHDAFRHDAGKRHTEGDMRAGFYRRLRRRRAASTSAVRIRDRRAARRMGPTWSRPIS